jgi:hypothetical protein
MTRRPLEFVTEPVFTRRARGERAEMTERSAMELV